MITNDNEKAIKSPEIFICKKCTFKCSMKRDYIRHLGTAKHKMITNDNEKAIKSPKNYECECGKNIHVFFGLIKTQAKVQYSK